MTNAKHIHEWVEDPMFADGTIMVFGGSFRDMGQETKVSCACGAMEFVPKNILNRIDLLAEFMKEKHDEKDEDVKNDLIP